MNACPDIRGDLAEACGRSGLLHNMSSPPKSRMTVQPLRPSSNQVTVRSVPSVTCSSSGLTWVMRIDLDRLIQDRLPEFAAWMADGKLNPGGSAPPVAAGPRAGSSSSPATLTGDHHLRLRCCLAIAEAMTGAGTSVTTEGVEGLRALSHENLCDQLRTQCARIKPTSLSLPALGMTTPADREDRGCEESPERVFYVLSHLSGSTFVRSGSAMIAGNFERNVTCDLWLPV